jgi:hypothetical protein
MEYTYEERIDQTGKVACIGRSDGAIIPIDLGNSDYQAYLNKDKVEQSTPMVTDETASL